MNMFRNVAALPLLLTLAACQRPLAAPPPAAPGSVPRGAALVSPPPMAQPRELPTAPDLTLDPARFKGLDRDQITRLLGAPSYQRRDADAEIWQYYGPSSRCVLDLFLYPDQGQTKVAHAELRSRGLLANAANACLADIMDGKRG